MKIIIAPDSYKGCMRSYEICQKLEQGLRVARPDAEIINLPMADGGEGTVEAAVISTGGHKEKVTVHGPLGKKVEAEYGLMGNSNIAVMEMASASGIELLDSTELNPWLTTTYGTGEMLRAILKTGIRDIIVGIGGSATNDGGAGMAQALGYRLLDADGKDLTCGCSGGGLTKLATIDASNVMPELKEASIRVACDVTNPLLGPTGASAVYGPQKGAGPELVRKLDAVLGNYAAVLTAAGLADSCEHPGDGAAGGLGFGLRTLCNAEIVSGAGLLIDITGLKRQLKGADLLITGEGCTDEQTVNGKLCAVIGHAAQNAGVPAVLISGALSGDLSGLEKLFRAMFSVTTRPCSLAEAMAATPQNLYNLGRSIAALLPQ